MSSFNQLMANVAINLNDSAKVRFTDAKLKTSIQNGYNDIAVLSQCIVKKVTLNWISDLSYYDFVVDCGVADFLGVVAIFNNVNRRWLRDDLNLSQFDKLRINWETWHGTPNWWAFAAYNKTTIVPKQEIASGNFDLYYFASAPTIVDFTTSPVVASDMQTLFEYYATAEQMENVDEFTKALDWWEQYYENLEIYRDRVKSLAQGDVRLRI